MIEYPIPSLSLPLVATCWKLPAQCCASFTASEHRRPCRFVLMMKDAIAKTMAVECLIARAVDWPNLTQFVYDYLTVGELQVRNFKPATHSCV